MIRKLLKYDIKKLLGFLVYFYVISFGLAIITRLINIGKDIQFIYIIGQVFAGITYASIAQILVNIFTQTIKLFNTDFYKDESYLTHTLPVTKSELLLSKYLSALIVIVISVAVCILDLLVVLYSPEFMLVLKSLLSTTIVGFNIDSWLFVLIISLTLLFQVCALMSMAFFAIVKCNTYSSNRIVKGFIWFFICYFASMTATLIVISIVFAITGNINNLFAQVLPQGTFISILITGLVCYLAYSFIFYFLCNKLFNKGVNVE